MKRYTIIAGVVFGCALVACANGQATSDEDGPADKPSASDLRVQSAPAPANELAGSKKPISEASLGPGITGLVELAKSDLHAKTGVQPDAIEILRAGYVTWPDASLGCPQPGYEYMQVLRNGSLILLRADKKVYSYHSGGNRAPFHCESPSRVEPLPYAPGEA